MRWIPNLLTLLRCVLAFVIAGLILRVAGPQPPAVTAAAPFLLFCLVALTDFFDGFLARRWEAVTDFGRFLDPVADKILVAFSLLALCGAQGWPFLLTAPTAVIVGRDVLVTALRLKPGPSLPVSRLAKVKTALEMAGIGGLLFSLALNGGFKAPGQDLIVLLAAIIVWAASVLSVVTGWRYVLRAYQSSPDDPGQ